MRVIVIAIMALSLSGCAATLGGRIQNFSTTDTIALQSAPRDFVGAVGRVGKSLGYDVTAIDRANNSITLGTSPSMLASVGIGKFGTFSLQATLNGRTVSIMAYAGGNYGEGGQAKVEERVANFKTALTREFGAR